MATVRTTVVVCGVHEDPSDGKVDHSPAQTLPGLLGLQSRTKVQHEKQTPDKNIYV